MGRIFRRANLIDGRDAPKKNATVGDDTSVLRDRANLDVIVKGGKFVECQLAPGKAIAKYA